MHVTDKTESKLIQSVLDFCFKCSNPALADENHVIVGYTNNLTLPSDGNDFCVITPLSERRVHKTIESDPMVTDNINLSEYLECEIQIDCYSSNRKDARLRVEAFELIAKSSYGVNFFRQYGIDCQGADVCRNLTTVLDSDQYVSRWNTTLTLGQWKTVQLTQDYFTDIDPELINVDAKFRP